MAGQELLYEGREQTLVKHYILRHYLERFAHIVGSRWGSITYVDGFAGPWNARSSSFRDSSFAIALEELRKARATLAQRGRRLGLRSLFLEENPDACAQLKSFASKVRGVDELQVLNRSFEEAVGSVVEFVRKGGPETFPFVFIDPTGWTGFALETIAPLLRLDPGEALINFMTSHIRRFIRDAPSRQSFRELFGSLGFMDRIADLTGLELEEACVAEYSEGLRREGRYQYVLPAIVLHPEIDRTHFHLLYATRHPKGVEVFKDAERKAMREMEKARAEAQQRTRVARSGQAELAFVKGDSPESRYYNRLRERYLGEAEKNTTALLRGQRSVLYEEVWEKALSLPLVWESDLIGWIRDWQAKGLLRVEGLRGRELVPKRHQNHQLIWDQAG